MDDTTLKKEKFVDNGHYDERDLDFVIPHISYLCFLQAVERPGNTTSIKTCARRFVELSESNLEFNSASPYALLDECLAQANRMYMTGFLEDGEEAINSLISIYAAYDAIRYRITHMQLQELNLQ